MSDNGMVGRAPAPQRPKLARGAKDEQHTCIAMSVASVHPSISGICSSVANVEIGQQETITPDRIDLDQSFMP